MEGAARGGPAPAAAAPALACVLANARPPLPAPPASAATPPGAAVETHLALLHKALYAADEARRQAEADNDGLRRELRAAHAQLEALLGNVRARARTGAVASCAATLCAPPQPAVAPRAPDAAATPPQAGATASLDEPRHVAACLPEPAAAPCTALYTLDVMDAGDEEQENAAQLELRRRTRALGLEARHVLLKRSAVPQQQV
jgi:hypothetical protein